MKKLILPVLLCALWGAFFCVSARAQQVGTGIGVGFSNWQPNISRATSYDFTAGAQSLLGETNAKTGTTSTRRDSDGNWQAVPTTTVRYHKSENRDTMTMLVEPAITNLLTCQKINVTATTNLTKGGDAAATLTVENDGTTAALIAASELQDLITNGALFLLDNTGGSGDAWVDFAGAVGTSNPASLSIFAAGGAAGNNGHFGLYDNTVVLDWDTWDGSNDGDDEQILEEGYGTGVILPVGDNQGVFLYSENLPGSRVLSSIVTESGKAATLGTPTELEGSIKINGGPSAVKLSETRFLFMQEEPTSNTLYLYLLDETGAEIASSTYLSGNMRFEMDAVKVSNTEVIIAYRDDSDDDLYMVHLDLTSDTFTFGTAVKVYTGTVSYPAITMQTATRGLVFIHNLVFRFTLSGSAITVGSSTRIITADAADNYNSALKTAFRIDDDNAIVFLQRSQTVPAYQMDAVVITDDGATFSKSAPVNISDSMGTSVLNGEFAAELQAYENGVQSGYYLVGFQDTSSLAAFAVVVEYDGTTPVISKTPVQKSGMGAVAEHVSVSLLGNGRGLIYWQDELDSSDHELWWSVISADSDADMSNDVQTDVVGTSLVRYRQDKTTPAAATDTMRLLVPAGKMVYFAVPQMEIFRHATTPIVSASTGALTRNRDDISAALPAAMTVRGGFAVKFYLRDPGVTEEGIFSLIDSGNGSVNAVALRTISTRPMIEGNCITDSDDDSTEDIGGIIETRANWAGAYWDAGQMTFVGPNLRFQRVDRESFTDNLATAWFGKERQFFGHAAIEIDEVVLFTGADPTLNNLADVMIPSNAIAVTAAGQSNMRTFGRDETSGSAKNLGERAIIANLEVAYPDKVPFWVDASVSGSNLDDDPSPVTSWMKVNGGDFQDGELLTDALEMYEAFARKGTIIASMWNQGESDQGGLTQEEWVARGSYILGRMRSVNSQPIGLKPPPNRTVAAAGYVTYRESFRQMERDYPWITHGPETFWLEMDPANNNAHLSPPGTVDYADYLTNFVRHLDGQGVSGGVIGAEVHYIERQGDDVYVAFKHEAGDNFSPDSDVQGFKFFDGSSGIDYSSSIRYSSNMYRLTLDSTPVSGTERLVYGYGTLSDITDFDDMIFDNSENILPARLFDHMLPYARYAPDQFDGLLIWHDSDVSTTVAQRDDLTGNGYHAFQNSGVSQPTIAAGEDFGKDALKFDTSNDYMVITTGSSLQAVANEATWEFVWKGTPSAGYKVIFRNDNGSNGLIIQNDASNDAIIKITTSAGAYTVTPRPVGFFDGALHHIVIRLDNGAISVFDNGVKVSDKTYSVGGGFASTVDWQQHAGDNLYDFLFTFYGSALSDDEIAQKFLYARTRWQI